MVKNVVVNLEILEQMIYFWQASSEGEKVGETYLTQIAENKDMALLYDDEYNAASVRKVLSAITNREQMNAPTKREWKLWNNNMWVMEEKLVLDNMVRPVKLLNVDALAEKLNAQKDIPYERLEILFYPGTTEEYLVHENKLLINFFRINADLFDEEKVSIEGRPVSDYVEERLLEVDG